jgi:predicted nucleotidyltransferase
MIEKIETEIDRIEEKYKVHILYAAEGGSRAWGFASPDSDYDVRFIYVQKEMRSYLSLNEPRDVIECKINEKLDINGWDLRKALRLLYKSNPALFEWGNSPIVYQECTDWQKIKKVLNNYFVSKAGVFHYLSMAKGNYRDYLKTDVVKTKKYLYVIRPILAAKYILRTNSVPPMTFTELIAEELDEEILPEVQEILRRKQESSAIGTAPRIDKLNNYIEKMLEKLQKEAEEMPVIKQEDSQWDTLNKIFYNIVTWWAN